MQRSNVANAWMYVRTSAYAPADDLQISGNIECRDFLLRNILDTSYGQTVEAEININLMLMIHYLTLHNIEHC